VGQFWFVRTNQTLSTSKEFPSNMRRVAEQGGLRDGRKVTLGAVQPETWVTVRPETSVTLSGSSPEGAALLAPAHHPRHVPRGAAAPRQEVVMAELKTKARHASRPDLDEL